MKYSLFLIYLLFSVDAKYIENHQERYPPVVGGATIEISVAPYQVRLSYEPNNDDGSWCGGSILSEIFILTAAHCVVDMTGSMRDPSDFIVHSDTSLFVGDGVQSKVNEIFVHEGYKLNFLLVENDVAVLKLSEPLNGNNLIPVVLPEVSFEVEADQIVELTGWGRLGENEAPSEKLMKVLIPTISYAECSNNFILTERMLCAGKEYKGACNGDSGGPLIYRNGSGRPIQVGIVSFGIKPCALFPAVFTKVSHPAIREFIREHTGL